MKIEITMYIGNAVMIGSDPNGVDDEWDVLQSGENSRGEHFPLKLYRMLEDAHSFGRTDVISWSEDGCSFLVHKPKVFEKTLMRTYFKHTKYKR
jgi:hypothetical protein